MRALIIAVFVGLAGCGGSFQSSIAEQTYVDSGTGCTFTLVMNREPRGEASWNGSCVRGLAMGEGKINWSNNNSGAPLNSEAEIVGYMVNGVLQREVTWKTTDYYSNLIRTSRYQGPILDGVRNGHGVEERQSAYFTGQWIEQITVRFEGEWVNNEFGGAGRREELKLNTDGTFEKLIESGNFTDNMLNGEGASRREVKRADGTVVTEMSNGFFKDRQFIGFGTVDYSSEKGGERFRSITNFNDHIALGGTGTIEYSDGDRFVGSVDAIGNPLAGNCNFVSKNYNGLCSSAEFPTSDVSANICLVSEKEPSICMKLIGGWIF